MKDDLMQEQSQTGERWRFTARPGRSQRVYLVVDGTMLPSRWIEMQPVAGEEGLWDTITQLPEGDYRFRYFIVNDGAYLNCGTSGLHGERLSQANSGVRIERFSRPAVPA
ncbi:MAG: hypothetical protein AAGH88_14740 [Planctomycetota bacterium]